MALRLFAAIALISLSNCDSLTIGGGGRLSDNVGLSVGTTITDEGVSKPRGKLTVGLF